MKLMVIPLLALAAYGADFQLKATPATVAWGYYWSAAKPVLRIKSGDTVEIQTMLTNSPDRLTAAGVKPESIEPELKAIYDQVKDKGPGGHILTGPIFIEGAEPGDTLEVRISGIKYAIPYAYNSFRPNSGVLTPEDFSSGATKIIALDTKRNVAKFSDTIEIPLRPFFGSMGVARRRPRDGFRARRRERMPAIWITRTWWRGPNCSSPCMRRAPCSKSATGTRARAMARWTLRRWRRR